MWVVGLGFAILVCLWAAIIVLMPTSVGIWVLGVGVLSQNVLLGCIAIPALGSAGGYLAIWKDVCVLAIIAGLVVFKTKNPSTLPPAMVLLMTLTCLHVGIYLVFPGVTEGSGITPAGVLGRLAAFRQWLVPIELILLGSLLARNGVTARSLAAPLRILGDVIAAAAIAGWFLIPIEFWVALNLSIGSALSGDISSASGQLEGLQSYFFGHAVARAVAPFGSPLVLAFSLIIPIAMAWNNRPPSGVPLRLIVLLAALFLSQTRGVIIGLVLVWAITKLARRELGTGFIAAMLLCLVVALSPLRVAVTNTITLQDPSSKVHLEAILGGFGTMLERPLGIGIAQGGQIGRSFARSDAGGENLYLLAANERGWLGLLLIIGLMISCGVAAGRSPQVLIGKASGDRSRKETQSLRIAATQGLGVLLVASLTTEHAIAFTSSWMVWVALGWASARKDPPAHHQVVSLSTRASASASGAPSMLTRRATDAGR